MNTKTATLRRLRAAAQAARELDRDLRMNDRVEVGLRALPLYFDHAPTLAEISNEGDDLDETLPLREAARVEQVRGDGYVAHLYFSSVDFEGYGDLINVITVWTGTDSEAPVVIHCPGQRL